MRLRTYDKEFKMNAIELYRKGRRPTEVSKDLGIPIGTLYGWIEQYNKRSEEHTSELQSH